MLIRVICIGDVVGQPGRRALREGLAKARAETGACCAVVNAENAAAGSGLTAELYQKVLGCGADVITLGDHIYRRHDIIPVLERSDRIVRPANFPSSAPGREFTVFDTPTGHRVAVVSLMGRVSMKIIVDCPFRAADRVLAAIPKDVKIVIVDMHAEATSEKVAMGWYLDGRVSALVGTHTHVPTGDERILPKGTAYITDLGMTGPYDSVLGREKDRVLQSMITGVHIPFDVAEGDARMCGVVIDVESATGRATGIRRICYPAVDSGGLV